MLATALWSQAALRFVLLGAATGSLTALVALGIALVYRTSGVLNFSAGGEPSRRPAGDGTLRLPQARHPRSSRARRLPRLHPQGRGAADRGREVQGVEQRLHRHPE